MPSSSHPERYQKHCQSRNLPITEQPFIIVGANCVRPRCFTARNVSDLALPRFIDPNGIKNTLQYADVTTIKPIDLRKRGQANAVRPYGYVFSGQSPYTVSVVPPFGRSEAFARVPFPGRSEAFARVPQRAREERSSFRLPSCAAACTSRAGGFSRSAACAAGANNPFPAVFAPANLRRDLSENREPDEYAHTLGVCTIPEISSQKYHRPG